jgi:hypothetical protein
VKDLLINSTDQDLVIENDDLVIGVSDKQHQLHLIMAEKGSVKQFPDAGVGAGSFLESEDQAGLLREISVQFTSDGMDVKSVGVIDGKIAVNAPYL